MLHTIQKIKNRNKAGLVCSLTVFRPNRQQKAKVDKYVIRLSTPGVGKYKKPAINKRASESNFDLTEI